MPILVRNIRVSLDATEEVVLESVAKRLRVPVSAIRIYAVVRRSLDARKKHDIRFSYQVELDLDEPHRVQLARLRRLHAGQATWIEPEASEVPKRGRHALVERPVVVGFGPGGMFAALRLAQLGYQPLVLERGREVRRRHSDIMQRYYRERDFDPASNLLFGEGGAGTYSDGKLYTRVNDPLCRIVLETFYHHGADPDVLIDARPHIGSDRLPSICTQIRKKIESLGGEVRFECQVDDIRLDGGALEAIRVRGAGCTGDGQLARGEPRGSAGGEWMRVGPVVLATGHSARDTIRMLHARGVRIDPRPFQIGVRIEHPQDMVNRWQYGPAAAHGQLGPAEYHMVAKGAAGRRGDVFSFCMCPGGMILPTNESPGLIATNGASRANRSTPFANSGLVITLDPTELPGGGEAGAALAGLAYLERWERLAFEATGRSYRVPVQRAGDFLAGHGSDGLLEVSYPLGGQWADISRLVPDSVVSALRRALPMLEQNFPGFSGADAMITAPETRASAPIRVMRDPATRQAVQTRNLYPIGEGAGYAGGIVSAAVDGIKTADAIVRHFAPLQ